MKDQEIKKLFIQHLEEQITTEIVSCVDFDGEKQNLENALQLCNLLRNLRHQRQLETLLVKLAKLQPRKKFLIRTLWELDLGLPSNIIRGIK